MGSCRYESSQHGLLYRSGFVSPLPLHPASSEAQGHRALYEEVQKPFPCSVSANRVEVDFKNPVDKVDANGCIYTESEIRKRLNIKMIDSWDAENEKVVKVSNKTVSSIIVEEPEPIEEKKK